MRCDCCDKNLNDFESTRKSKVTGEYLNMCNTCFTGLGIETVDRGDLNPWELPPVDEDEYFEDDEFLDLDTEEQFDD